MLGTCFVFRGPTPSKGEIWKSHAGARQNVGGGKGSTVFGTCADPVPPGTNGNDATCRIHRFSPSHAKTYQSRIHSTVSSTAGQSWPCAQLSGSSPVLLRWASPNL